MTDEEAKVLTEKVESIEMLLKLLVGKVSDIQGSHADTLNTLCIMSKKLDGIDTSIDNIWANMD